MAYLGKQPSSSEILNPYSTENPLNPTQQGSPILDGIIQVLAAMGEPQAAGLLGYYRQRLSKNQNQNLAKMSYMGASSPDVMDDAGQQIAPYPDIQPDEPGLLGQLAQNYLGAQPKQPRGMSVQEKYAFDMGQAARAHAGQGARKEKWKMFESILKQGAEPARRWAEEYAPEWVDLVPARTLEEMKTDNLEAHRKVQEAQAEKRMSLMGDRNALAQRRFSNTVQYQKWQMGTKAAEDAHKAFMDDADLEEKRRSREDLGAYRSRTLDETVVYHDKQLEDKRQSLALNVIEKNMKPYDDELKDARSVAAKLQTKAATAQDDPSVVSNALRSAEYVKDLERKRTELEDLLRDQLKLPKFEFTQPLQGGPRRPGYEQGLPAPTAAPTPGAGPGPSVRPLAPGILPPRP